MVKSTWKNNPLNGIIELKFNEDNTYIIDERYDGYYQHSKGSYSFEGNIITFKPSSNGIKQDLKKPSKYIIEKNDQYIMFNTRIRYIDKESIDDKLKIFVNLTDFPKEGVRRKYSNEDVIIEYKKAMIIKKVYLRKGPSINEKPYKVLNMKQEHWSDHLDEKNYDYFLPINYEVSTICRTVNKHKVDNINNYWYYIKLDELIYDVENKIPLRGYVWIYGEYLKFK